MFGFKTKSKTSYPETFYLDPENFTMCMDYETREFLDQLRCGVPYKGRYIDSLGVKVELEYLKGVKFSANFFKTEPTH